MEHDEQYDDGQPVDQAVPGDGVPVRREWREREYKATHKCSFGWASLPVQGDLPSCEEAADCDDSEDVEDRRSHDGAHAQVRLRHESADHVREELGGTRA